MTTTPNAPDAALLPCAHCGGDAVHVLHEAHAHSPLLKRVLPSLSDATEQHEIACDACGIGFLRTTLPEAIAAWNRRAGQSHADAGLLAALERSTEGWANALELGLIPERHRNTAEILAEQGRAAIAAAKGA